MFDSDDDEEAHERRIRRCRICNRKVIWLPVEGEPRQLMVDEDTVEASDECYDHGRHVRHRCLPKAVPGELL